MDKAYWPRIVLIIAMFLGSIYVLLPTILQADPQSRFAEEAAGVETPTTRTAPDLDVEVAVDGDPAAAAERLEALLDAAEVAYDRVAVEEDHLIVLLVPGATSDEVAAALDGPAATGALYPFGAVVEATGVARDDTVSSLPLPDDLAAPIASALDASGVTWAQVQTLAGRTIPDAVEPAGAELGAADLEAGTLEASALQGEGPWMVAVDGALHGLAWPGEGQQALSLRPLDEPSSRGALEALGASAGFALIEEQAEDQGATADKGSAEQATSRVPPWLVGMLPDTRMNLGLDLQGGISLTLQVELDEAVLSQVSRDLTYLEDQAAREGVVVDEARADRSAPWIYITTSDSLSALQGWFAQAMPDYEYLESPDSGVHLFGMTETRQEEVQDQAVTQVLETLRKRVDATGVKEPSIVRKGGGAIDVQLPGMVDLQAAIDAIGTTAMLEFRLVDEEFDQGELQRAVTAAEDTLPEDQYLDDGILNEWLWKTDRLPDDRLVYWEYKDSPDEGHVRQFPYVLKDEVILTGNDVNNAGVAFDRNNLPFVSLEFKPKGARVFCTVTGENVKKRFAIILDDEVESAPSIRERICGGRASIEMGQSLDALQEAETLALVLRTGSLNAPVSVGQVRTVGATLGQDAIQAGSVATFIGGGLVLFFMAFWYRKAGMLADMALFLNVVLVLAILSMFGATLTLPGIAGIALTVGMAVDANIIIYERIREELQLGQHARKAVDTGFDKGLVAVVDANVTTAIAGVVLYSYGTGPIKGFAVTLLIGIGTTLITALFVNRTFMELATRSSTARLRI